MDKDEPCGTENVDGDLWRTCCGDDEIDDGGGDWSGSVWVCGNADNWRYGFYLVCRVGGFGCDEIDDEPFYTLCVLNIAAEKKFETTKKTNFSVKEIQNPRCNEHEMDNTHTLDYAP
jgi:hypothetical protein